MREGERQRGAFQTYYRLGDERSIERLHDALAAEDNAPSIRTLYDWSSRFGWQSRLDDIELVATSSSNDALAEEARELNEFQATIGRTLQVRGTLAFRSIDPTELTPAAALRAVELGARLERKARGADYPRFTDITESIRAMAIREGLDPDQAVRDAADILGSRSPYPPPRPAGSAPNTS